MSDEWVSIADKQLFAEATQLYQQAQFDKAFAAYSELARRGYKNCQIFVGWMHYEGKGTPRNEEAALTWFKKAADSGSAEGMFYCARLLDKLGKYESAASYLRSAGAQGYAPALCRLGRMRLVGRGIAQDTEEAYKLLERAAELGNVFAKRELAVRMLKTSKNVLLRVFGAIGFLWCVVEGMFIALVNSRSEKIKT
jgi:TPR repeat protein